MPNLKRGIFHKPIDENTVAIMALPVFVVFGSILSMAGAFIGLFIGMTVGGNFPVLFEYGGLPGYEGAGLFGNMAGSAVASLLLIRLWLKEPTMRKSAQIVYVCLWLIAVVVQHFVTTVTHAWWPPCIVTPIIVTGLVAPLLQRRQNQQ